LTVLGLCRSVVGVALWWGVFGLLLLAPRPFWVFGVGMLAFGGLLFRVFLGGRSLLFCGGVFGFSSFRPLLLFLLVKNGVDDWFHRIP
jgi:hypothetical protein